MVQAVRVGVVVCVVCVVVSVAGRGVLSWDADPMQDVCVADLASALHANGQLCKPTALVTAEDFVYRGMRHAANASSGVFTGVVRKMAKVKEWPGLNTQGMSMVRVDFEPGGVNPPHLHPRATEIARISRGTIYAGFVTTGGHLYAQTLQAGDLMVFPRGLIHFQLNLGKEPGVLFGSLNSQDPRIISLPSSLFSSYIPYEILSKSFLLPHKEIQILKSKFEKARPHSTINNTDFQD